MPLFTIKRQCKHCDPVKEDLRVLRDDVEQYRRELSEFRLDFESLYDKVRTNLSKLSRREKASESPESDEQLPLKGTGTSAGQVLLQRHLRRG